MAYTFFPTTADEIQNTLSSKGFPQPNVDEVKRLFNLYIPTPVPAIWLFRLILIQIIENIVGQYATYEVLEKGLKQCGDFENLWPSEKYLDLTFE